MIYKPTKEGAMDYLKAIARGLPANLEALCMAPLNDPRFAAAPGGASHHHNYPGGLAEHVAEVVHFCILIMGERPHVNSQVLLTAAIWHDYDKVREYYFQGDKILKQPYMMLVGHPVGSTMAFVEQVRLCYLESDPQQVMDIVHCMLAHHGRREWGSPVEPKTPEAYILHSADMLSAQPLPHGK